MMECSRRSWTVWLRVTVALLASSGAVPVGLAQPQTPAAKPAPELPLKLFAQLERTKSAEISPDGRHFVTISNKVRT